MTDDEEREIVAAMREAMKKARGYADYFGWAANRDLEEWGVMQWSYPRMVDTLACDFIASNGSGAW
jgi:hypothetical protein